MFELVQDLAARYNQQDRVAFKDELHIAKEMITLLPCKIRQIENRV